MSETPSLESVAPEWLEDNLEVLETFLTSPAGFILGAVLSQILGGVETLFEALIDGFAVIILGSDGEISATGTYGIADLPLVTAVLLSDAVSPIVTGVIDLSETVTTIAVDIAALAGPLAPVIFAIEAGLLIAGTVWVLRTIISVAADAIPGVQGLIK